MNLIAKPEQRAKAMGEFGFVMAGGGSVGVLLGGLLTAIYWHWIFLVNLPIGAAVFALTVQYMPTARGVPAGIKLAAIGALTVTAALIVAVYAIVNGTQAGWLSAHTLGLLAAAAVLFALFLAIKARVPAPLEPLKIFRLRYVVSANAVGRLWSAALFARFFIFSLYF